ncbi:MAG: PIG-L family deacetylase, partial [Terracidiphilus sp.]
MKFFFKAMAMLAVLAVPGTLRAQTAQTVNGADERFKADILVVVAHPDDEVLFSPYLARAIDDQHKRVAVVYGTRGGRGGNGVAREHGPALANVREMEAREACARLGIAHVWFLDGRDTASQNLMDSLTNWGHGANLEQLVALMRLTRPEVVFTQLPAVFIGEDHGDHQAVGVLATEAFDLAADPLAFPAQLAGDTNLNEPYQSNLLTWQPRKLYFASDADDQKQFAGSGPAYSIRDLSPSRNKAYWRMAMDSATAHRTQFAEEIAKVSKLSDEQLDRLTNGPGSAWWPEPLTLIFGKSLVGGEPTGDVFAHIDEKPAKKVTSLPAVVDALPLPRLELGGSWRFYAEFYRAHSLAGLPTAKVPEIAIAAGTTLLIPVVVLHDPSRPLPVSLTVLAPEGWKAVQGAGELLLPAEESTSLPVRIETPVLTGDASQNAVPREVLIRAETEGKPAGEVRL